MNDFIFTQAKTASVPVAGSNSRFPVRRIYCVGQNYAAHAREMGGDPDRAPPFFFSKPADTVLTNGSDLPYPPQTSDLHFEAELVVAIGKPGRNIEVDAAPDHIWGYAAGNDFTRRDLQAAAKKQGRPWDMAKGFDLSAGCGSLHPVSETGLLDQGAITCKVEGMMRQQGDLSDMIWSVPEIVAYLSGFVGLEPGDLIYTGTPAGVGAIQEGETVTVEIAGLSPLVTHVTSPQV